MTELMFDRPRALKYRNKDLRELCKAAGTARLADLLDQLRGLEPTVITLAIRHGLAHDDARLTLEGTDALIDAHRAAGGTWADLLAAIAEALNEATGLGATEGDAAAGEAGARAT